MLQIRDATPADAAAIAALLGDLGYPAPAADIPGRLAAVARAPGRVLVADDGGEVVGVASVTRLTLLHLAEPAALLSALVVRPDRRARGVGHALVEAVARHAGELGCATLELTSRDDRHAAHRFYRELGFESGSRMFVRQMSHA
ncbi:MAG TPA: GNAT family N-acetyltransferase [Gemmatimonadales bacterium]|nr:GNAT family N-acetyltransferase [Gemmatimonadales bacterium]